MKTKRNFKKKRKLGVLNIVLIILVLVLLVSNILSSFLGKNADKENVIKQAFFLSNNSTKISMYLPAVDIEGKGVNTILTVEATSGTGRTLTDIDNLLFWADTQHSIRMARKVAENITGKNMINYDIIYTIQAAASLIGGPSAGSALTLASIAALENKKLKENVMITGSINHDGTIGPVSSILEKAKASKDAGATLFLVPLLQGEGFFYEIIEHCEVFGNTEICTTETRPRRIDISGEIGIEVIEVESIKQAMDYFFE